MPFDPATILVSGLLSGAVAWATATAKTGRDERGKQIAAARRAVSSATEPLLVSVARFDKGLGSPRSPDAYDLGDIAWAAKVLRATDGLGPTRRRMVIRRLRRLAGSWAVDVGMLIRPDADVDQEAMALSIALHREAKAMPRDKMDGLVTQALRSEPGDRRIRRAVTELRLLAACSIRP